MQKRRIKLFSLFFFTVIVSASSNVIAGFRETNSQGTQEPSYDVVLGSPYLTFRSIEGGLGLTVELENIGDGDARNVTIAVNITGGIIVHPLQNLYHIPLLPAGNFTTVRVRVWGISLGFITDLPVVKITVQAPDAKTRGKCVVVRVLGPFVRKIGESWTTDEAYEGYTLYTPMVSTKTFLINNSGDVVHQWNSSYKPALSVYLLENGRLLRTAFPRLNPQFWGGGIGGRVELIDWNGSVSWSFDYTTDQYCLHHDVKMLPNGNILMIAWEYKSAAEAIAAGRDPSNLPMGELWPDHLIEVQPHGESGGTVVWEWHLWDHLIQDYDPTKANYGVVADHPELIDINYGGQILADWTHTNSVDYNEEFDQLLLSVLTFNEVWVIDHSTTFLEAAGHTGGRYGKGGDLLYRWGNPVTYRRGDEQDQQLFHQHDAEWIKPGLPGAGNILIFNNGRGRPEGEFSSVDEIVPPMDTNGNYSLLPELVYGPTDLLWTYSAQHPTDFYAINLGGVQRLPNGNTLVCIGPSGVFFEVTAQKEVVWEYFNQFPNPIDSHVFKVQRYGLEYPGLRFL